MPENQPYIRPRLVIPGIEEINLFTGRCRKFKLVVGRGAGYDAVEAPPATEDRLTLVVATDNRYDSARQPLMEPWYDFYGYGGIYRDVVWAELRGALFLDRVRVTVTDLDRGRVRLDCLLRGPVSAACDLSVSFDGGKPVAIMDVKVANGTASVEMQVPQPRKWLPEDPFLHTVTVRAGEDAVVERFGLRTVRTEGKSLLLNGRPLKLRGYCRHEAGKRRQCREVDLAPRAYPEINDRLPYVPEFKGDEERVIDQLREEKI